MEQYEICVPFLLRSTNKLLPFIRLPHALYCSELCSDQRTGSDPIYLFFFHLKMMFPFPYSTLCASVLGQPTFSCNKKRVYWNLKLLGFSDGTFFILCSFWGVFLIRGVGVFLLFRRKKRIFRCHIRIRLIVRKMSEICTRATLVDTMLWFVCRRVQYIQNTVACLLSIQERNVISQTTHTANSCER